MGNVILTLRRSLAITIFLAGLSVTLNAQTDSATLAKDTTEVYFIQNNTKSTGTTIHYPYKLSNRDTNLLRLTSFISFQQMSKGNLGGVYAGETSGEPGVDQNIFVQGINGPLLTKKDLFEQQAVIFLNGIPLTRDHPFAYEIQKSDYTRIGTNTNNLAIAQLGNIESIEVIKDPARLASLGPIAANGAIWITTKNAVSAKNFGSVNVYSGYLPSERVSPTNSAYEIAFRRPFYNKYASIEDIINMPAYLKDSTNVDYYGPANWYESYYKPRVTYGADASLTGGSERANFRLFLSSVNDANSADNTSLQRHNAAFFINIAPTRWLNFASMINYNRIDRTRNRGITERLSEQRYLPDLSNPLTPNRTLYDDHLYEFTKVVDDNVNHSVQSYFNLGMKFNTLQFQSSLMLDYSDISRDYFTPATLLENNNFVSHYLGINQRVMFTNSLSNRFKLGDRHSLNLTLRQQLISDFYRYKYAIGYNGPNDFIKVNLFHTNTEEQAYISYYFPNSIATSLQSFSGELAYSFGDVLDVNAVIRRDGSSTKQVDHRWFSAYSASFDYDLSRHIGLKPVSVNVYGGYARVGKVVADDRFSSGPIYSSYIGWQNEPALGTYLGLPALVRPYSFGWVGNEQPWAYYEKLSLGGRLGLLDAKLIFGAEVYSRDDKNGSLLIPTPAEWGYEGEYRSGMVVNNRGVDLSLFAQILKSRSGFLWSVNGNISFNSNRLKALPNKLSEIIIGNNKLQVGQRVDAFWLYKNLGIFNSIGDIPTDPSTGAVLTYNGVPFGVADAYWADTDGNYDVNNYDRILAGNYMPKQWGGFGTVIAYKNLSLDVQFYLALGQQYLNQYASSRLDFVNSDFSKSLSSVKEITFWTKGQDLSGYTQYNPWSSLVPYQLYQDIFLENASYAKLRSATLSYKIKSKSGLLKMSQIYITGTNLLTFSKFKGGDPELINYQGIYDGKSLPIPTSAYLGLKLDF